MVSNPIPAGERGHTKVWRLDATETPVTTYESACTCDLCEDGISPEELKLDLQKRAGVWACDACAKVLGFLW